jgi:hypothetical protein
MKNFATKRRKELILRHSYITEDLDPQAYYLILAHNK